MEKKFNEKERQLNSEIKQNETKIEEYDSLKHQADEIKEVNKKLEQDLFELKSSSREKIKEMEDLLTHNEEMRDTNMKSRMTLEGENKRLQEANHVLKGKIVLSETELTQTKQKLDSAERILDERIKEVEEKYHTEKKALEIQVHRLSGIEQQFLQRVNLIDSQHIINQSFYSATRSEILLERVSQCSLMDLRKARHFLMNSISCLTLKNLTTLKARL